MEINSETPNIKINFRKLEYDDYDKGYFELLSMLTEVVKPNKELFIEHLTKINSHNIISIFVLEHNNLIIASVTLITEPKFIRNLNNVCHVEDFVIHSDFRKMKLGTEICKFIKEYAVKNKCYKIILDCSLEVQKFYEKQGYVKKSEGMALYLN